MKFLLIFVFAIGVQADCKAGVKQCAECSDEMTCSRCYNYFYLVAAHNSTPCASCHSSCETCSGPRETECITCPPSRFMNDEGKCQLCSEVMSKCAGCDGKTCTICATFYFLDPYGNCGNCTELANVENCYHCQSPTKCYRCNPGFYTSPDGKCIEAITGLSIEHCVRMYADYCASCEEGYYLKNSYKCELCSKIDNCETCDGEICSKCLDGYYADTTTSCKPYSDLVNCAEKTQEGCKECKVGYYKVGEFVCEKCDESCYDCKGKDPTQCSNCKETHYLEFTDEANGVGTCELCAKKYSGCLLCKLNGICTKCAETHYLGAGPNCKTVNDILHCSKLNNRDGCAACNTGYFVYDDVTCARCSSSCFHCNGPKETSCTDCYPIHYLEEVKEGVGICRFCYEKTDHCNTCTLKGQCLTCVKGYYLADDYSCQPCNYPCTSCRGPGNEDCDNCKTTHYLTNADREGFGTCTICNYKTILCEHCYLNGTCSKCEKGYYLTSNSFCAQCQLPCTACEAVSNTKCTNCIDIYYLKENEGTPGVGSCTTCFEKVSNCTRCTLNGTCLDCKKMHYLDENHICRRCYKKIHDCMDCSLEGICSECRMGYYLDRENNVCKECDNRCNGCVGDGPSKCLACYESFYMNAEIGPAACLKCPAGCTTCKAANKCLGCLANFELRNGQCISTMLLNKEAKVINFKS
jgi:hypothetical protein